MHFERVLKVLELAGGQFSVQNGDDFRLPKIHRKIHGLLLYLKEPESRGASWKLDICVFWDTLVIVKGGGGISEVRILISILTIISIRR